jgi:hypothetical protein
MRRRSTVYCGRISHPHKQVRRAGRGRAGCRVHQYVRRLEPECTRQSVTSPSGCRRCKGA